MDDRLARAVLSFRAARRRRHLERQDGTPSPAAPAVPGARGWAARAAAVAVGAAVLTGVGAANAQAEQAPARAGWDGTRYWYKDETGWWRWTRHHAKYQARTQAAERASAERTQAPARAGDASSAGRGEPVFRGRSGWDPVDRVYWYRDESGRWRWTGHRSKFEQRHTLGASTTTRAATNAPAAPGPADRTAATSGSTAKRKDPTAPRTAAPARGLERAIAFAEAQVGEPYVWGGEGPNGWDCSGLVQEAYRKAGIALPRVAVDQYRAATPITRSQLRRGDLVFWTDSGSVSGVHHVAVYLGDGKYLEAPRPGRNVRVSSFSSYNPNLYGRVG
ncbi:C40 family peptidase [Streptomyces sp. NPDC050848]|uniref:C40 family peptidase n=1 Tax=Streptomyces sp. NPDC050848 TaxID=3155791 RepID=UPI0034029E01